MWNAPSEHLSRWPHRVDDLGPFSLVDATATVDSAHRDWRSPWSTGRRKLSREIEVRGAVFRQESGSGPLRRQRWSLKIASSTPVNSGAEGEEVAQG